MRASCSKWHAEIKDLIFKFRNRPCVSDPWFLSAFRDVLLYKITKNLM